MRSANATEGGETGAVFYPGGEYEQEITAIPRLTPNVSRGGPQATRMNGNVVLDPTAAGRSKAVVPWASKGLVNTGLTIGGAGAMLGACPEV